MTKRGRNFQTKCLTLEIGTMAAERLFIMIYTQQVAEIMYLSSLLLHSPIRQHLFSVQLEITWFYNTLRIPIWTMSSCKITLYIATENCLCTDYKIDFDVDIYTIHSVQMDAAVSRLTFSTSFLQAWLYLVLTSWRNISPVAVLNREKSYCLRFEFFNWV